MRQPDVAADRGMVTDGDAAEYRRVAVNDHVVFQNRVARTVDHVAVGVILEALRAKGHSLVERDVAADDGGLADDNSRAVVDTEVVADGGAGMDVDARLRVGKLGDDAWKDRDGELVKLVGDAVVGYGVDHGVAEDDLTIVVGGGVVVEHCFHVGIEQAFHFGQAVDELQGEVGGTLWRQPLVGVAVEEQSASICSLSSE